MTDAGTLSDGRAVGAFDIASDRLTVRLLDYGARLSRVVVEDGPNMHLTAPLSVLEARLPFAGPIVGPVANRLAGASAPLDGRTLAFDANEGGITTLHSGRDAIHAAIWAAEVAADAILFTLDLPDGAGGFPGNRRLSAEYRVSGATLALTLAATTDRPTLMNLASHGVWNLDGSDDWAGHRLTVPSDRYIPVDDRSIPTGEIASVDGTPYDHRAGAAPDPGLDHNFCFDPSDDIRELATLTGGTGRRMVVISDAPGLQVYAGAPAGLAIEPQLWPDAPHHPQFPSIRLDPGQTFRQRTEFRFG